MLAIMYFHNYVVCNFVCLWRMELYDQILQQFIKYLNEH